MLPGLQVPIVTDVGSALPMNHPGCCLTTPLRAPKCMPSADRVKEISSAHFMFMHVPRAANQPINPWYSVCIYLMPDIVLEPDCEEPRKPYFVDQVAQEMNSEWRFARRRFTGECSQVQHLGGRGKLTGQVEQVNSDAVTTEISVDVTGGAVAVPN